MTTNKTFFETKIIQILDEFNDLSFRVNIEKLIIFYIIQYFKLSNILEIGFCRGESFAAMLEATAADSELTAIDIHLQLGIYNKYYANSVHERGKNINLIEIDSAKFTSEEKYDFINVDGNHSAQTALNDITKSLSMIQQNGILMIDDYKLNGVDQAVDEIIKMNTGFVPFLVGEQASFWHHESHDAAEFLDVKLEELLSPFCSLYNIKYKSYEVKEISCLPAITNHNDIFKIVCERYKI